ncbi:hypothetical protein, partial [uncultured Chryseobacterium sp.]|uniref:hypothetical protein n=1 Tax=uncultured Chryseobacterium sp. TaxID=259322 RepID=UPI0026334301
GGGGSGGTTDPPENNTPPCTEPTIPTNPESGFTDENGCPIGTPTLPNLGSIDNDPCFKTKGSFTKANEVLHSTVGQQMDVTLKGKVNEANEWGVALGQKPDGSYEITNAVEGTPSSVTPPLNNLSIPSSALATAHSHAGAFGNPSGGDMFSILGNMVNFPNLRYSYVYGISPSGVKETYALVVNDKVLADAFLSAYPKIDNYDENSHDILKDSKLGKEFNKMRYIYAFDDTGNTSGEYYDKGAVAMAYILEKFNSGMSIAKADANGNLKKINASIKQTQLNGILDEKAIVSKCP